MHRWVTYCFVLVAIILFVILFQKVYTLEHQIQKIEDSSSNVQKEEEIEVADVMMKLQRHSSKLWFAGREQNWPLADFYVTEVEEAMSTITDQQVTEEGVDLTELMKMMGKKPLKRVRKVVKQKDSSAFREQYRLLIRNCNDCHRSSNHEFIQVKVPQRPASPNQSFRKKES